MLFGQVGVAVLQNSEPTQLSLANSSGLITLDSPWVFRKTTTEEWMPATVPGTVHTDLLENKIIEDPFYRTNEKDLQWTIIKIGKLLF
ncbi:MAG: hypothetical protein COB81_10060 [Flavobacteriaceae bacterium]|nr:MAG: hypothetical protein COB81_10060 [Flavobacteriaceae bacterium]